MVSFREPESTWRRVPALALPAPTPRFCQPPAGDLATFATRLFAGLPNLPETPTADQVARAQLAVREACYLLQERWFEIRSTIQSPHKDHVGNEQGDLCVYGVYVSSLRQFVDYRNRLPPPPPLVSFEEVRRQYKALKQERARQTEAAATHWHPLELDHAALVNVEPE